MRFLRENGSRLKILQIASLHRLTARFSISRRRSGFKTVFATRQVAGEARHRFFKFMLWGIQQLLWRYPKSLKYGPCYTVAVLRVDPVVEVLSIDAIDDVLALFL